jgi:hypothetical protein
MQVVYEKFFLLASVSLLGLHLSKVGNMSKMLCPAIIFHIYISFSRMH